MKLVEFAADDPEQKKKLTLYSVFSFQFSVSVCVDIMSSVNGMESYLAPPAKLGAQSGYCVTLPFNKNKRSYKFGKFRQSSCTILVSTSFDMNNSDDSASSKICVARKSDGIQPWAGSLVFPGGLTSFDADSQFTDTYLFLVKKFNNNNNNFYNKFTYDEILYRITALRELFEESGILLGIALNGDLYSYPRPASIVNNCDLNLKEWREKVLKSPYEFEIMFSKLGMIPCITSLVPWARFQTPYSIGARFDTRYYLSLIDKNDINSLNKSDNFYAIGKEIDNIDWFSCKDLLNLHLKYFNLPPPIEILIDELNIIINEKNLYNEWKYNFVHRNIIPWRANIIQFTDENKMILFYPKDYMYYKYTAQFGETKTDMDNEASNEANNESKKGLSLYRQIYFSIGKDEKNRNIWQKNKSTLKHNNKRMYTYTYYNNNSKL